MASHVHWIDTQNRRLVSGFNSNLTPEPPVFCQGDSVELELHLLRPTGALGSLFEEVEFPAGAEVRIAVGRIDAKPTLGTFRLSYGADITTALPHNATAAAVQDALSTLPSVIAAGGLTVQGSNGGPWTLYWTTPGERLIPATDTGLLLPASQAIVSTVRAGTAGVAAIHSVKLKQFPAAYQSTWTDQAQPTVDVTRLVAGGSGQNELQRVRLTPMPYAGSFSLRFGGVSTAAIAFNASATTVQEALVALPGIGTGKVAVTEVSSGTWDVQFIGTLGGTPQPLLEFSAASLRGFRGKLGILHLDSPGIEDLLEGRDSVNVILELQVSISGAARTYLQVPCTVLNDMIEGAVYVPPPFETPVTLEAVQTLLEAYLPRESPGSAMRVTQQGLLQLKNATTGLWHTLFVTGAEGAETLAIGPGES
jgi:hypothetical protein